MNQQLKKIFSIALALFLGLGIVFFSWKGADLFSNKVSTEGLVSDAWKDSLFVVPGDTSTKTLVAKKGEGSLATTTSDIVARDLLLNYGLLSTKLGTTTLSDEEATSLAQGIAKEIGPIQGPQYTTRNLNISSDNSPLAVSAYSEGITRAIQSFASSRTKGDLEIVLSDPRKDPVGRSTEVQALSNRYKKLVRDLLSLKTPSRATTIELRLVQVYSNIEVDLAVLANIYTDPTKALVALTQYKQEVSDLETLSKNYEDYLLKNQQ